MSESIISMPRYKCHKEIRALKIQSVEFVRPGTLNTEGDGSGRLTFEEAGYPPLVVSPEYMRRHGPIPGGYYVRYNDGYESWSPAEAFEAGYTRID